MNWTSCIKHGEATLRRDFLIHQTGIPKNEARRKPFPTRFPFAVHILLLLMAACTPPPQETPAPLPSSPSPTATALPKATETLAASGIVPAFPGAQGGGAETAGGRGGKVVFVTSLEDNPDNPLPGTLRYALEKAPGPRIVIFRVGGTIKLRKALMIGPAATHSYVTIAGQTAPGDGITLSGEEIDDRILLYIYAHDVVIRYIRFQFGTEGPRYDPAICARDASSGTTDNWLDNLYIDSNEVNQAYNIIVDHASFFWANHIDVTVWADGITSKAAAHNITVQNSISAEGTYPCYGYGFLAGSANERIAAAMTDIDFHHNLLVHHVKRFPEVKLGSMRWVNNLVFDWRLDGAGNEGGVRADYIANQFWSGPTAKEGDMEIIWQDPEVSSWGPPGDPSFYLSQNIGEHNQDPNGEQWVMIARHNVADENLPLDLEFQRFEPLYPTVWPITVDDVEALPETLLGHVGTSQRLDGNGGWITMRDTLDQRAVDDFLSRASGIKASEVEYGGRQVYNSGEPYPDEDANGLSDAWETAFGIKDANGDADNDGYTNIEEFLNATDPTQRQDLPSPVPTAPLDAKVHPSLVWINFITPESGKFQVEAQVTILDAQDEPVSGANVCGYFNGPASEKVCAITADTGTASLKTSVYEVSGEWSFCLGGVRGYEVDWLAGGASCIQVTDPNVTQEQLAAMKEADSPRYFAKQVDFVLDGKLDEWVNANVIELNQLKDKGTALPGPEDFSGKAQIGWNAADPERIYIAVVVTDDQLQDSISAIGEWWNDDSLEVLFDFKKEWEQSKGAQFSFGANGKDVSAQAATAGSVEYVQVQEGKQYIFEIAITPGVTQLGEGFLAQAGQSIGFTIQYNDGDHAVDKERDHQIGWTKGQTWDPANWGLLVFDPE
jgi:pectate lyase